MPKTTLNMILATDCCVPSCDAPAADDMPFPLCVDCYLDVVRHFVRKGRALGFSLDGDDPIAPEAAPVVDEVGPAFVYFVQLGSRVKIGTSRDPLRRLKAIPHERLLALIPGDATVERKWHQRFGHRRTVGEWFELDADDLDTIHALGIAG